MLPMLASLERPMRRLRSAAMAALPNAPLWEMKAIGPGSSTACGIGEAFIGRWKLRMPRQLGPIRRMRPAALATTSCCSLRPSSPTSWKPAVNTTAALADTEAASAIPAATCCTGMLTSTRSTGSGRSCSEGNVRQPQISAAERLIG